MRAPKAQIVLDYKNFYGTEPPANRIGLIAKLSKIDILTELVALNNRLLPNRARYSDTSYKTQIEELMRFTRNVATYQLYKQRFDRQCWGNVNGPNFNYPLLFTRQTCLYAIEEILNSESLKDIPEFDVTTPEVSEAFLRYILAVNTALTTTKESDEDTEIEGISAKMVPLNELNVESGLAQTIYRGYALFEFFHQKPAYQKAIEDYFQTTYGLTYQQFLIKLQMVYTLDTGEHGFLFYIDEKDTKFFNDLSIRYPNRKYHTFLSIRKSPFYKFKDGLYLIIDFQFFLEKCYYQFINDFWFDCLKNSKDYSDKSYKIDTYKSDLGYFFESHLSKILKKSLGNVKHSSLLLFDDLKVDTGKGSIEVADFYYRYDNKILLGQAKAGSIYDNEKYGGDLSTFYKGSREGFFKNFGVDQMVESIINLELHISKLDAKFSVKKTYKIFPCIILNDKVFQTPLMAQVFNERFNEIIGSYRFNKLRIKPLTLIGVNELEDIEESLTVKPKIIWKLLDYHTLDSRFITVFSDTVNKLKVPIKAFPEKIKESLNGLFIKHYQGTFDNKFD